MDFTRTLEYKELFIEETLNTIYMVVVTGIIAGILGLILGVLLLLTEPGNLKEHAKVYFLLDKLVNIGRSIPFVILLALVSPLTRFIVGTGIGNTAVIVPLVLGTTPFYARQVQNALSEVPRGTVEAAVSMGMPLKRILLDVYLSEARGALIRATAMTLISLVGLTAMAGAIAAGGLGKVAITYGYNRFRPDVTLVATVLILIIVFIIQWMSHLLIKYLEK